MAGILRICLQSLLKLVNSIIGMAGIAMVLYSLWMLRLWFKHNDDDSQTPWFIYAFLGVGIYLCVITFSGHVAAETANGYCLSCYTVFIFLIVLLEAAVIADIFLNSHWDDDFPEDPTGRFDEFKVFVKSNFELCKWIGIAVVVAQALSIFLAIVLRALGPYRYYDSDDEYAHERAPLLKNSVQSPPYGVDPHFQMKNDAWNARGH